MSTTTNATTIRPNQAPTTTAVVRPKQPTLKYKPVAKHSRGRTNGSNNRTNTRAKTALCKFFAKGHCPRGNRCTFAHGEKELVTRPQRQRQQRRPCWYHNNGGCSKSAEACVYDHVIVKDLRKPIHLQHPCVFFHHQTPAQCVNGDACGGDHFYELTESEWRHHFPEFPYPGTGYIASAQEKLVVAKRPLPKVVDNFPALVEEQQPTPNSVWSNTPDTVRDSNPATPEPEPVSKPVADGVWSQAPKTVRTVEEQSVEPDNGGYVTLEASKPLPDPMKMDWADMDDDEVDWDTFNPWEQTGTTNAAESEPQPVEPEDGTLDAGPLPDPMERDWADMADMVDGKVNWDSGTINAAPTEPEQQPDIKQQIRDLATLLQGSDLKLPAADESLQNMVGQALEQLLISPQ